MSSSELKMYGLRPAAGMSEGGEIGAHYVTNSVEEADEIYLCCEEGILGAIEMFMMWRIQG
ncbi:MAG: hypothetical protein GY934_16755 [Gammaproteobacteria bacterium]|nr:hypothetical protein [Gammaproteobacteria bacterium]